MRRWIPYPLLAVSLFVMWLLLTQSISPGQIVLGAIAAIFGTKAMAALRPERSKPRSARAMITLAWVVAVDIIRSNFAVAALVLSRRRAHVAGFVEIPLDLRDHYGLTLLALIITATPGTIWVQFDRGRSTLLIHILDLVDEDEWIHLIKTRYEALLLEIFES